MRKKKLFRGSDKTDLGSSKGRGQCPIASELEHGNEVLATAGLTEEKWPIGFDGEQSA